MKLVLILGLLFLSELSGTPAADALERIPSEDRQDIDYLFDHIFLQQDGAYAIFGDKPVSVAALNLLPPWKTMLTGFPGNFAAAWQKWQKYNHLFPMKAFIMVCEKIVSKKSGAVTLYVFVINKDKFVETLRNHHTLFEAILHENIEPLAYLQDIETGKKSFLASIQHRDVLLGLLLGYGKHNAFLYENTKQRRKSRFLIPAETHLDSFDDAYPMMVVNPVQFRADLSHPETQELKYKYQQLRKEISSIYSKGNLLEITLTRLISD